MSKREKILMSVGSLICAIAYVMVPKLANADNPAVQPNYQSTVQRSEELSPTLDWTRAIHATCGAAGVTELTTADAGAASSELNYMCFSNKETVCLGPKNGIDCFASYQIPANQEVGPISFYPNLDGGQLPACIVEDGGVSSELTCVPVIKRIARGR